MVLTQIFRSIQLGLFHQLLNLLEGSVELEDGVDGKGQVSDQQDGEY